MLNFLELKQEVAKLAQRHGTTSAASTYRDMVGIWLNMSQDFLAQVYDYYTELQGIHNFTTVDGREDYPMPTRFDKPLRIADLTTPRDIEIETEEEYIDESLNAIKNADEDAPSKARIYGTKGITGNIGSSGTTVKVKSSSASDTSGIIVRVEGWLDSAKTILGFENITVSTSSPTTAVAGTTTFYDIIHISKSADTVGYITITDSSDVTLLVLQDIDRVANCKVMKLGLIPDDAYSMRVWYKKQPRKMVNDYDYPFIDADNYFLLDAWGWALSQEKDTVDRSIGVWNKAEKALNALLTNIQGNLGPDYQQKIVSSFAQAHRS